MSFKLNGIWSWWHFSLWHMIVMTNGILFGSKSKGKLSPRSHHIKFERKWKYSFVSVVWKYLLLNKTHSNESSKFTLFPNCVSTKIAVHLWQNTFLGWKFRRMTIVAAEKFGVRWKCKNVEMPDRNALWPLIYRKV